MELGHAVELRVDVHIEARNLIVYRGGVLFVNVVHLLVSRDRNLTVGGRHVLQAKLLLA